MIKILIILLITSCATRPELVAPLTKKPQKKARKINAAPIELITDFYESYLISPQETDVPLSKSLTQLINDTNTLCAQKAKGDICGWEAHGDPYLDGQEYSDRLNLKSSQFKAELLKGNKVRARFNIYPDLAGRDQYQREITYQLVKENGNWVINDIFYNKKRSARKFLEQTKKNLQTKSFSLPALISFSKKEKLKTNLKNLKRDKIFYAYKSESEFLSLALNAYPGPERFNQVSLNCNLCNTKEVSLSQTLLCQGGFKSLYQSLVNSKDNEDLNTFFKQARSQQGIRIPLPEPGHLMRVDTGALKCDGLGGRQIRVDIFLQ